MCVYSGVPRGNSRGPESSHAPRPIHKPFPPAQAIRAAHAVLAKYDSNHPADEFSAGLVRIIKASRQVVAGTLTRVELEWAPSACRKPAAGCAGVGAATGTLRGKVWSQPWRDCLVVTMEE